MQRSSAPSPAGQPAPNSVPQRASPTTSKRSLVSSSSKNTPSPVLSPRRPSSSTSYGSTTARASDTSPSRRMSALSISSGFSSSSDDGATTAKKRPIGPQNRPSVKSFGPALCPQDAKYSPSPSRKPSTHVYPVTRRDSGTGTRSSRQIKPQGLEQDLQNHAKALTDLRSQQHTLKRDILRDFGSTPKTQPAISTLTNLATAINRGLSETRELISQMEERESTIDGISDRLISLVNDAHFHAEKIDEIKREVESWKN